MPQYAHGQTGLWLDEIASAIPTDRDNISGMIFVPFTEQRYDEHADRRVEKAEAMKLGSILTDR